VAGDGCDLRDGTGEQDMTNRPAKYELETIYKFELSKTQNITNN